MMARYYANIAGVSLRKKLEELSQDSPDERHSLSEELDMARVMVGRALRLYEATFESPEAKPSTQAQAMVLDTMRSALKFVNDTAATAAKVRSVSQGTVDVEQLDYIVDQVTRIVEDEITPLGKDVVDRVALRLRDIKMPDRGKAGAGVDHRALAIALREAAEAVHDTVQGPEE